MEQQFREWLERKLNEAREELKTADHFEYGRAQVRYTTILKVWHEYERTH